MQVFKSILLSELTFSAFWGAGGYLINGVYWGYKIVTNRNEGPKDS